MGNKIMKQTSKFTAILLWLSVTSCLGYEYDDFTKLVEQTDILEERSVALETELDLVVSRQAARNRRFFFPSQPAQAFTAALTNIVDHLNPFDHIKFDTVITQVGTGYDNQTAVYTAPYTGIYIFSCSLLDHLARSDGTGDKIHAEIVKNSGRTVLGRVFAHAARDRYRDQGEQTVLAYLNKGDKVWVRNKDSKDLSIGGELYSTFSGYLLFPAP